MRACRSLSTFLAIGAVACTPSEGPTAKRPVETMAAQSSSSSSAGSSPSSSSSALGYATPTCPKDDCGPAPAYPTGTCPDGIHVRGRGPCTRFADGSCHWTHLVCPPAPGSKGASTSCTAKECGPPAAITEWLCPDGVHTGEFGPCVGDDQGHCGWAYRACSGVAQGATSSPPVVTSASATKSPFRSCDLPGDAELRTWEVHEICPPGSGPDAPSTTVLRQLGDGTFVVQLPYGCLRARYRKCTSK